jgi:hypothetical protein
MGDEEMTDTKMSAKIRSPDPRDCAHHFPAMFDSRVCVRCRWDFRKGDPQDVLPMRADEVLAVLDHHEKQVGKVRVAIGGGFNPDAIRETLNDAQKGVRKARTAVAAMIEREAALETDLARVSEELGLPPKIGPAPGVIRALAARVKAMDAERVVLRETLEVYASTYNEYWQDGMPILEPLSDSALATARAEARDG